MREDNCKPTPVSSQLPEREAVVQCFFNGPPNLDEEASWERRKQAMRAMEALIGRHEAPRAISQRQDKQQLASTHGDSTRSTT
jgi:hypothetical protein